MFVDTNVFVYARSDQAPNNRLARELLDRALHDPEPARISRQILREYFATVTRHQSWDKPADQEDATRGVENIGSKFEILEDGPLVTATLLDLCCRVNVAGRQIHDANVVATILAHGERHLLTFNFADFRRYEDRIEILTE